MPADWPRPRRLLVELDDGRLYACVDVPEVVAASLKTGAPYQIVMPGRSVEALDSDRPHLMMQVDDRAPVGAIASRAEAERDALRGIIRAYVEAETAYLRAHPSAQVPTDDAMEHAWNALVEASSASFTPAATVPPPADPHGAGAEGVRRG